MGSWTRFPLSLPRTTHPLPHVSMIWQARDPRRIYETWVYLLVFGGAGLFGLFWTALRLLFAVLLDLWCASVLHTSLRYSFTSLWGCMMRTFSCFPLILAVRAPPRTIAPPFHCRIRLKRLLRIDPHLSDAAGLQAVTSPLVHFYGLLFPSAALSPSCVSWVLLFLVGLRSYPLLPSQPPSPYHSPTSPSLPTADWSGVWSSPSISVLSRFPAYPILLDPRRIRPGHLVDSLWDRSILVDPQVKRWCDCTKRRWVRGYQPR